MVVSVDSSAEVESGQARSSLATAAARNLATTTKSAPAPAPAVREARWADTLRPLQADLQSATGLFEEGDYAGAVQRLRTARAQVERWMTRYPNTRPVRQVRDRIDRQISQIRTACEAEATAAARRGRTVTCP